MGNPFNALGQGFTSTPGFKLYQRGLIVQTIQRFRGINAYQPLTQLPADWAQDCLNVIVGSSGLLSKMRLPVQLAAQDAAQAFWDFQQGSGTRQVLVQAGTSFYSYPPDFSVATLIETNGLNAGKWSMVEANNILFGANGQRMQKWTGKAWQPWGIAAPNVSPVVTVSNAPLLSPAFGYQYKIAWENSVTGHVGNASPSSSSTGVQINKSFQIAPEAPTDTQVDTQVIFRTLDGGGDFFYLCEVNIKTGVVSVHGSPSAFITLVTLNPLVINDGTPDSALDLTVVAPLVNGVPPQGKFLTVGQGRIFVAGLTGNLATVAYSGYEQILFGRPEESFPPFNQILLSIGAESITGIGVLQIGVVMFSSTNRMYFLRGAVEDITLSTPVVFSERLEELPWSIGCLSHETIKSTPYGLIWLASDKTVQFWDGRSDPVDISENVYPLLRGITAGAESATVAAYFNWLERDWYALLVPMDGSLTPNRIFMFALNHDTKEIDVFPFSIPALWIGSFSTATLQRQLLIADGKQIAKLPVVATDIGGLTVGQFRAPSTAGSLRAFWRGGYFGNDSPQRSKMFRWVKLIPDTTARSYQMQGRFVDDANYTVDAPFITNPIPFPGPRLGVNRRANRFSVEIDFPEQDTDMNVLELQVGMIPTSDR